MFEVFFRKQHHSQGAATRHGNSGRQGPFFTHGIQNAGYLTGVPPGFIHILLESIDFLDYRDRYNNIIVFELEQGLGIMEQYIGIKDKVFHDVLSGLSGDVKNKRQAH